MLSVEQLDGHQHFSYLRPIAYSVSGKEVLLELDNGKFLWNSLEKKSRRLVVGWTLCQFGNPCPLIWRSWTTSSLTEGSYDQIISKICRMNIWINDAYHSLTSKVWNFRMSNPLGIFFWLSNPALSVIGHCHIFVEFVNHLSGFDSLDLEEKWSGMFHIAFQSYTFIGICRLWHIGSLFVLVLCYSH